MARAKFGKLEVTYGLGLAAIQLLTASLAFKANPQSWPLPVMTTPIAPALSDMAAVSTAT